VTKFKNRNSCKASYTLAATLCALLVFESNVLQANSTWRSSPQQANGVSVESRVGHPLTKDEHDRVVAKTIKHPRVASKIQGHRVRALRVVHDATRPTPPTAPAAKPRSIQPQLHFLTTTDAAANSRFSATIGGVSSNYFLLAGNGLSTAAGTGPKSKIDVCVNRNAAGNPFKPFGTWQSTLRKTTLMHMPTATNRARQSG
jgi:hypothetical protein